MPGTITFEKMIAQLFEERKYASVRDVFKTMNPADIAAIFAGLEEEETKSAALFRLLPKELAAESFVEMDPDLQEGLIKKLTDQELKQIIDELYLDDAVDLVEEMPANVVKRILRQADPETRELINEMLKYPKDSAGSMMTNEFVYFRPHTTAAEAIALIRKTGLDSETINICYVTDTNSHLVGTVTIRRILLAKDDETMDNIMESNVISVHTLEDKEKVAEVFRKYTFIALPVVDGENRLVGIVTVDDAIDLIEEEATEDIEIMAAITPSSKPYLKTSAFSIWKSRIPWLLLLMISATFTGMILNHFEDALAAQIALVAYIPMLMGAGGNSGSQASTTVIRGLSLGEIELRDVLQVIWKEVRVAFFCGVTMAVANFLKMIFFDHVTTMVALVVCITLALTVLFAKVIGAVLPILSKKLGLDPAVMASPFMTTFVDALSLLIYFATASALLQI